MGQHFQVIMKTYINYVIFSGQGPFLHSFDFEWIPRYKKYKNSCKNSETFEDFTVNVIAKIWKRISQMTDIAL